MLIYLYVLEYWHSFLPGVGVKKIEEGRG